MLTPGDFNEPDGQQVERRDSRDGMRERSCAATLGSRSLSRLIVRLAVARPVGPDSGLAPASSSRPTTSSWRRPRAT